MVNPINKNTIATLNSGFLNIGKPETERLNENIDSLVITPSKHDHINLEKTYLSLRKGLIQATNIISRGGKVLVYTKHGQSSEKILSKFFTQTWPGGLVSNFKKIGKNLRPMPSFVVVSTNDNLERGAIENELIRCKIASVFITSTNNKRAGTINVPGSNSSANAANLVCLLFKRAITFGLLKEAAKLKKIKPKKSIRKNKRTKLFAKRKKPFPRLGSNQRPRT